jgi:hypothetical protein
MPHDRLRVVRSTAAPPLARPGLVLLALLVLLIAPAAGEAKRRPWRPHVAAAREYAEQRAGEVAFAVIDQRGRFRGYRVRDTSPMASTFKVMLMAALMRKRGDNPLSESDRQLLAPMIRVSDNYAAEVVRGMVGERRIRRLARAAKMRDFEYNEVWGLSRSSPRDQVRFMYHLPRYIPKRHRAYARYLLSHVVGWQRWGIGRVVPPGWKLFLKGGWGSGTGLVDHQIALLKDGRRRVALAIFTELQPDHEYGKQTLRGVAARLLRGL